MYKVILIAEDGTYVLTDAMSEVSAIAWVKRNERYYGDGQRLTLEYAGPYFGY